MSGVKSTEIEAGETISSAVVSGSGPTPKKIPLTILLSGCTFNSCSIAFSDNAVSNEKDVPEKVLQRLSYHEIFEDYIGI